MGDVYGYLGDTMGDEFDWAQREGGLSKGNMVHVCPMVKVLVYKVLVYRSPNVRDETNS